MDHLGDWDCAEFHEKAEKHSEYTWQMIQVDMTDKTRDQQRVLEFIVFSF